MHQKEYPIRRQEFFACLFFIAQKNANCNLLTSNFMDNA